MRLNGTIVSDESKWIYDLMGITATCPADIREQLEAEEGDEITLEVNSGGGDVFAGNEMYYILSQSAKHVTVDIVGFAGSAATIVCCGADKVRAVPSAQYMIHNVSCGAQGDYHDLEHQAEVLKSANGGIATLYQQKTGMEVGELLELMDKETWMNAQTAKDYGFIDEVIGEDMQLVAAAPKLQMISAEQVAWFNHAKALMDAEEEQKRQKEAEFSALVARLEELR